MPSQSTVMTSGNAGVATGEMVVEVCRTVLDNTRLYAELVNFNLIGPVTIHVTKPVDVFTIVSVPPRFVYCALPAASVPELIALAGRLVTPAPFPFVMPTPASASAAVV